jgi:hypothetical protein
MYFDLVLKGIALVLAAMLKTHCGARMGSEQRRSIWTEAGAPVRIPPNSPAGP